MAVWRAISAAFCAAFAAAAAAFCVAFAVASAVLIAALEVFSAVFTALSVDFTVPFAPAFTVCFPAERADCLMVRSVRSADLMVWFRLAGNLVSDPIGHILSGIADFILRILGVGNLPIVHQVFCLLLDVCEVSVQRPGGQQVIIQYPVMLLQINSPPLAVNADRPFFFGR